MKIAILILAAGSSLRMGVAKQLLPVGKTTLLGITITHSLKSKANKVYCVLGSNVEAIQKSLSKYNINFIFNPNSKSGLSSSIVEGIKYIKNQQFDATLIVLGDQPLITSDDLNVMIETFKRNKESIIASTYKNTFGVPAIIPKIYYKDLLVLKGDKGAKDFLNMGGKEIIASKNANLTDIDTKKDFHDYLKSIKSQ